MADTKRGKDPRRATKVELNQEGKGEICMATILIGEDEKIYGILLWST